MYSGLIHQSTHIYIFLNEKVKVIGKRYRMREKRWKNWKLLAARRARTCVHCGIAEFLKPWYCCWDTSIYPLMLAFILLFSPYIYIFLFKYSKPKRRRRRNILVRLLFFYLPFVPLPLSRLVELSSQSLFERYSSSPLLYIFPISFLPLDFVHPLCSARPSTVLP